MDGVIFVTGLLAGVTLIAVNSRRSPAMPGVLLTLLIAAGCFWYAFA